jgi:hypothetical protein
MAAPRGNHAAPALFFSILKAYLGTVRGGPCDRQGWSGGGGTAHAPGGGGHEKAVRGRDSGPKWGVPLGPCVLADLYLDDYFIELQPGSRLKILSERRHGAVTTPGLRKHLQRRQARQRGELAKQGDGKAVGGFCGASKRNFKHGRGLRR